MIKKGDCLELMKQLPDNSVDAIVTDPPYEYLQHKLDRHFNEQAVFEQWNRIVKPGGFIVFFGRGESFHRWNVLLNEMGWKFKEEIVWNKIRISSPVTPISRVHETVSLLTKSGKVRKHRIPYLESSKHNLSKIQSDLSRIKSAVKNEQHLTEIENFLQTKKIEYSGNKRDNGSITVHAGGKNVEPGVRTFESIVLGQNEKDIITETNNRFKFKHPTQKPTQLMERLIALVSDPGNLILDPFMGSGSTGIAAINTNREFIGYEIDDEYFEIAKQRIRDETQQISLDLGGDTTDHTK